MAFPITLSPDSRVPLYRQLCDALREAIVSGRLRPGQQLPSQRDYAQYLGLSRNTVLRSYEELLSQGYLQSSTGMGTFVAHDQPAPVKREKLAADVDEADETPALSRYGHWLLQDEVIERGPIETVQMNFGASPPDCLPIKQWRKILLKHCRDQDMSQICYQTEPFGYPPLREAIASYLRRVRSVRCDVDQVVLFHGTHHALNIISRVLIDADDLVSVENPGFCDARQAFLAQRARLYPISIDEFGLVTDELLHLSETPKLISVSPCHQDPTGVTMSEERRRTLLQWAHANKVIILEDDYDSEFVYGKQQLLSLQGMDEHDNVIYMSNFWKTLFPILTLSYLVIPRRLIPVFSRAKALSQRTFPMLEQTVLTEFLNEGHMEWHIRKTKTIYAKRRQALIFALNKHFQSSVSIGKDSAGMHILVRFDLPLSDDDLIERAAAAGVMLSPTWHSYLDKEVKGEFLMPFAHIAEADLDSGLAQLKELVAVASR